MRLIIASHVPLAPSSDGAWLAFHGVAEVAEGLAARGWRTTVLGRAVAMEPASRAVEGGVSVVAVAPRAGVWRDWWEAARAAAGADAALIFMPSLACALLAAIMGPRAIVYAGGAWASETTFPAGARSSSASSRAALARSSCRATVSSSTSDRWRAASSSRCRS
jgi:hypothetical protein